MTAILFFPTTSEALAHALACAQFLTESPEILDTGDYVVVRSPEADFRVAAERTFAPPQRTVSVYRETLPQ